MSISAKEQKPCSGLLKAETETETATETDTATEPEASTEEATETETLKANFSPQDSTWTLWGDWSDW